MQAYTTVDEYISAFPLATQKLLKQVRVTVRRAAPGAEETISYGMPAYKQNGVLVYFGGYKSHIGFYPTAIGIKHFEHEISSYKNSKGAVQFPLDKPLPCDLISKIVLFRVKTNMEKAAARKTIARG